MRYVMEFVEVKTEYYLSFEKVKTNKISRVDTVFGGCDCISVQTTELVRNTC